MTQRSTMTDESSGVLLALRLHVPVQRCAPVDERALLVATTARTSDVDPTVRPVAAPERSWALHPYDAQFGPLPRLAAPGLQSPRRATGSAWRRTGSWVVNLVVLVTIAAFLGLAIGPHTGAYRTTTMLTGSMRPLYPPGAVLVITPQPASEVAPGQVLTFNAPTEDRRVVTHRVVSVDHSGPKPVMITKGDANNGNDPWSATLSGDTVWRVQGAVPFVGRAIQELRRPNVQLALTRGLPAVLLLSLLVSIWRPSRKTEVVDA